MLINITELPTAIVLSHQLNEVFGRLLTLVSPVLRS